MFTNGSGRISISFRILANLTGNSCRKNVKDVLSHAFSEPVVNNIYLVFGKNMSKWYIWIAWIVQSIEHTHIYNNIAFHPQITVHRYFVSFFFFKNDQNNNCFLFFEEDLLSIHKKVPDSVNTTMSMRRRSQSSRYEIGAGGIRGQVGVMMFPD